MSLNPPNPTYTASGQPVFPINAASVGVAPPVALPLTSSTPTLRTQAHGKVKDHPRVVIDVDGACTVTVRVWSEGPQAWRYPAASSTNYQKTFAAAGWDYFELPVGSLFHLSVDSGTVLCYADCERPISARIK